MNKKNKLKKKHIHTDEDAVAHMIMNAAGNDKIPDLSVEIITSAMRYLKMNPTESIESACAFGMSEWVK